MICSLTILSDCLYSLLLIPANHLSFERDVFVYLVDKTHFDHFLY